jgi:uncharacterized protein (DUF2147 family)
MTDIRKPMRSRLTRRRATRRPILRREPARSLARTFFGTCLGLALATVLGGQAAAAGVTGLWHTDGGGVVEIRTCAVSVCGRLMSTPGLIRNPAQLDVANENVALRGRLLKGIIFVEGFRRSGESWVDGTIYDPNGGDTYAASLELADANTLKVSACMMVIMCKTMMWTRAI